MDHRLLLLIGVLAVMSFQVHCKLDFDIVNVTILKSAVSKGAVCLDGTPPGYHYAKGFGDGANHWIVYLQGGGWCATVENCLERVQVDDGLLGSSRNWTTQTFSGILSQNRTNNPDFYNWNRVLVRYCDGSAYMGDVEAIDPENNLHRRGARIFKFIVDDLLAKGMNTSKNVILAGSSAGGLATMLNCDRSWAFVPNTCRVKCIADAGLFLHAKHIRGVAGREEFVANFTKFHNITKLFPTSCTSKINPALCIFPENFAGDIQTPLFILNSDFDRVQFDYLLNPYSDAEEVAGWKSCLQNFQNCTHDHLKILKDFRTAMLKALQDLDDCPSRGVFINACYIHDMLDKTEFWIGTGEILGNKTVAKAVGDWYFDRSSIKEIDTKNTDLPKKC